MRARGKFSQPAPVVTHTTCSANWGQREDRFKLLSILQSDPSAIYRVDWGSDSREKQIDEAGEPMDTSENQSTTRDATERCAKAGFVVVNDFLDYTLRACPVDHIRTNRLFVAEASNNDSSDSYTRRGNLCSL